MEVWKDIKGYDGVYEVSNKGDIRRKGGKVLSPKPGKLGYKMVALHLNGYAKKYLVHRLVAEAFIPNPEDKPYVNHIDGDKANNCVDNLEWVTPSENIKHAYAYNLRKPIKGENNKQCKISDADVEWIRENAIKGDSEFGYKALAIKFGVTEPHIYHIVKGLKR